MDKRLLAVLATLGVAAVVAGLSAAATSTSRRDSGQEPKRAEGGKAAQTTPRASTSSGGVVKSPQTGVDETSYWTPERMKDAQPLEKTVPNGSPSSSATPSGGSAPAGAAPVKSAATNKSALQTKEPNRKPSRAASDPGGLTRSPGGDDAAGYWTPEKMDDAQPTDQTVPGGNPSGGSSSPDPGGGTAPGAP